MKLDPKLLLASMGISAGIVLFVMGLNTGLTGRDATNLPDAIENISPGQGERVLRQSQIIVDFIDGYEATMFIDGIELPTTRLDELVTSGTVPAPGAQIPRAAREAPEYPQRSAERNGRGVHCRAERGLPAGAAH